MKKIEVAVPAEMAQEFEKKLVELNKEFDGKLEIKGYRRALDTSLPIKERVQTFEDACLITGKSIPAEVIPFIDRHTLAYMKLCIIAEALRDGWTPQYTTDEYRYFPWFTLWHEDELEGKSDEWKAERNIIHIPAVVGGANSGSGCGVSHLISDYVASVTSAYFGGALAARSSEIAVFFGKRFIEIWIDYIVGNTQHTITDTSKNK